MANWTQTEIGEIWEKAEYIDESNEAKGFRKDQCGAWIKYDAYGNRKSKYGWEIDHIKPSSKGGEDIVSNARPLHWKNNASRQDGRLECVITSYGTLNILSETGEEFIP